MLNINELTSLEEELSKASKKGMKIGLVPTMGALHDGHMELIKQARRHADYVIVSIFINPLQFNQTNDFINYPSNLLKDSEKLKNVGVDLLFSPDAKLIYPKKPVVKINFGGISNNLEGAFRLGHFEGVGLVVMKLFNLIKPNVAFFGLKDLQQYVLIKHIIKEFSYPIKLLGIPTVRGENGLALSSRNVHLSPSGIKIATRIYEGLIWAKNNFENFHSSEALRIQLNNFYQIQEGLSIEYCEILNTNTFKPLKSLESRKKITLCVAAHVEGVRLIDNVFLRE
tara:strand:- start:1102 stop:1950 length:849 start_codon:yes stop_codon:yes gene_type:complete